MLKQRLQVFKPIFWLSDFFLSLLACFAATVLYFYVIFPDKQEDVLLDPNHWFLLPDIFVSQWALFAAYAHLGLLFSVSQVFIFEYIGIYQLRYRFSTGNELLSIFKGVLANLFVILTLLFFYRLSSFSRVVVTFLSLFTILFVFLGHRALWILIELFYQNINRYYTVLIIGMGKAAQELIQTLSQHRAIGYHVLGIVANKAVKHKALSPLYIGPLAKLGSILKKHNPAIVIYADKHNPKEIEKTIGLCDLEGIDCHIVPALSDFISIHSRLEDINGVPLLHMRSTPLHSGYSQFFKRLFDIVFAFLVIFLSSPLFILVLLLLKADGKNKGPVFFAQERVGLNRKPFLLWKFRTMHTQDRSRSDKTWGTKKDTRITKLGHFLRKTSIDELPQFWNVLIGDMSIVGPRPERPFFVRKFKNYYVRYMQRHAVKSGITGWAQVQGLRGDTSIDKRVEADIYYIENWSFWLDISILLKTLPAMIRNPGS